MWMHRRCTVNSCDGHTSAACILAAPQCCRQTHTRSSTFAPTRWHTQQHGIWYPFIRCHGLFVKPDQTHPFIARGPQSIRSRTNLTKHNRRCSRKTCDRHAHTLRHEFSSDHTTPMHVSCPLQRIACLLRWPALALGGRSGSVFATLRVRQEEDSLKKKMKVCYLA